MADSNVFLPFPRGTTAAGGPINPVPGTATAPTTAVYGTGIAGPSGLVTDIPVNATYFSDTTAGLVKYRPDLAGYITAPIRDGVTIKGSYVRLRCVQNGARWLRIGRLAVPFATTTKCHGIVALIAGSASTGVISVTAGLPAKMFDPAYPLGSWIAPFDWFWTIEEGAAIATIYDGVSITGAQWPLMVDTDGTLAKCTAGNFVVAMSDVSNTVTDSNLSGATLYYPRSGVETAIGVPVATTGSIVYCKPGIYFEEAAG